MIQRNFLFITFCLVLLVGLLQTYGMFREYFSPAKYFEQRWSQSERDTEREKLKVAILQSQMQDYQTEIAGLLPAEIKGQDSAAYQMRNLASVARTMPEPMDLSSILDQKAKSLFKQQKYAEASSAFKELTERFPTSGKATEAYFFSAESLFLMGQYQQSLDVIDHMIQHFPDSELTGFIMLRMGQILESRNRPDEAKEVYKVILQVHGKNNAIRDQAQKLLKTVEL